MQRARVTGILAAAAFLALTVGVVAVCAAEQGGAHHPGGAAQLKDFMWRLIDFAALVIIAVWALKKADVKGNLAARRSGIESQLKEAVAAKEAADAKFQEYNERLEKANSEIEGFSLNMKREGELEKERIVAEAHTTAARILEQAETAANQEILKAKTQLRAEAARLAVELAEQKIKANIAKKDQDRLVGDYISKVGTLH